MTAFQRSAVFAAALVLLAIHAEASVAPVQTRASCTVVTPAAATTFYNNFTQICCPNGGVKTLNVNADPYSDCCHDNINAGCPPIAGLNASDQITCCRPEPARVATDLAVPQWPRNCYSPQFQGCCRAQYLFDDGLGTATSLRVVGDAEPFDFETQQCCSTGTSQPLFGGADEDSVAAAVIVPKALSSCVQFLRKVAIVSFRCLSDSMCPGYRAAGAGESRGKCCRRPIAFGETAANYDAVGYGTCFDPRYEGCCDARIGDVDYAQSAQANYSRIFDLRTEQCCKLPVVELNVAPSVGGPQKETYIIASNAVCPCLADTDCPTANYTCCAPSQTQIQDGTTNGRRLVQCAGAAGAPDGAFGGMNTNGVARFPGCYGKCVASGPSGAAIGTGYVNSRVCLNSLPNFVEQCKDLRVEEPSAWAGEQLVGVQWRTPRVVDGELTGTEWSFHEKDCCKAEGFSVLYKPADSTCCPVMGSAAASGVFPRRLTPVVPRQNDDTAIPNAPQSWSGCLCAANSDCQAGYVCCENGNSWVTNWYTVNRGWVIANQLLANRPDGTVLNGICINPNTTDCCKLDRANPDTATLAGSKALVSVPYLPDKSVCCVFGGWQNSLSQCGCHTNADCPGEFGACCTANSTAFGSGTHAAGKCYDTRTSKCCQYHTSVGTLYPLNNAVYSYSAIYDEKEQVCCPWGGIQASLWDCECRSDHPADDCGANNKCCSGMAPTKIANNTTYRQRGMCYNPSAGQGCCQSSSVVTSATAAQIYDTVREVCCAVNGRQADHRSCRCSADNHCPANGECCMDGQAKSAGAHIDCNDAANPDYCPGRCIHKEIETCCDMPYTSEWANGDSVGTCVKDYQKCCDGQCCNKATETCKKTNLNRAALAGTQLNLRAPYFVTGAGGVNAGYHYGLNEDSKACTVWEHSSPSIVFHTWVFPAFLSVASIIVVLLGSRAGLTADVGSNLNRMVLVGLQVFVAILSILLLWSPLWKYGFGIIFANSFILHSFVVGGQWTRRIAVILLVVTFLWVYEPFGTNVILSFGTVTFRGAGHDNAGQPIHGLNYAARMLQRPRDDISGDDACTEFYMYWKTDAMLHDARTWNPQGATRGICRRSWMHTIVVLAGIVTPFEAVWLFLAAVALARASQATKDVKVQPIQA
jgi:hypothetical protein